MSVHETYRPPRAGHGPHPAAERSGQPKRLAAQAAPRSPGEPASWFPRSRDRLRRGADVVRSMARTAPVALLDQMAVSGFGFLCGILAARLLDVREFATFVLVVIVAAFAQGVQHTIVAAPLMTLAGGTGTSSPTYDASVLSASAILSGVLSLCAAGVLLAIFAIRGEASQNGVIVAAAACTWAQNIQFTVRKIQFSRNQGHAALTMDLCRAALFLAVIAFLSLRNPDVSAEAFVWALTATSLVTAFPLTSTIWKRRRLGSYPAAAMRRHWPVAKWLLPIVFLTFGQEQLVWILAGVALGDDALGGLRASQYLIGVVSLILASTENILPNAASRIYAREGLPALNRYLMTVSCVLAPAVGALLFLIAWNAEALLQLLFGLRFATYAGCVQILCSGVFLIFIRDLATIQFRVVEKTSPVFLAFLASFSVTAIVLYPLMTKFGAPGVAAVIFIGHLVSTLVMVLAARRSNR